MLEVKSYKNVEFVKLHKYKTYMGIKIENVIITYQKKDILELVYWIRKHMLKSIKK